MYYLISPVCSVKLDCDRNSVMRKSDIEHMVNSSLPYAGFLTAVATYLNGYLTSVNCRPF